MKTTYLIVGNGVASLGAVEGIRRHDPRSKVMVVGEEDLPTYGRPLISYYLSGKIDLDRLLLRPDDFYDRMKVDLRLSTRATGLDTDKRVVTTNRGESIEYSKLLIATGGRPIVPRIPGADGPGIYFFTTLAHARQMMELAKNAKHVVVVGGGLIGLKAAESLNALGVAVTVVELMPRVLSSAFDGEAAFLLARRLGEVGITVYTNVGAEEIARDNRGRVAKVLLNDGTMVKADAVVLAIGVAPNSELAEDGGLEMKRGLLVDDMLMTSKPDIYGAGDVAEAPDILAGEARRTPIWPNAYGQGYRAGRNMTGVDIPYEGGLAMNAIAFHGLSAVSVGVVNPPEGKGYEVFQALDEEAHTYRKLVYKDNLLKGCVLVGEIEGAGLYTGFIRFKHPIDDATRRHLEEGRPSVLNWPEEFLRERFGPTSPEIRHR